MRKKLLPLLALVSFTVLPAVHAAPEKWVAAIDAFAKKDAENPPPAGGVVFVGSSSIGKWTSLSKDFPDQKVLNRGFGGSELYDSVYYADRVVIPYKPRVVVVYAGDNDLKAGKTPETVAADFKAFRTKVHAALPETKIVFIGIKPSPSRWDIRDKGIKANQLIAADCATDKKRLAFVDIWQVMLGANGEPRPELYVADKLHMTPAGYAVWTPLVAAAIK